jgi:hypothetical protein
MSANKTAATPITKGERDDLQRLIRQREEVLKSAAKQRSAELLADFENQMGVEFSFDDDVVRGAHLIAILQQLLDSLPPRRLRGAAARSRL